MGRLRYSQSIGGSDRSNDWVNDDDLSAKMDEEKKSEKCMICLGRLDRSPTTQEEEDLWLNNYNILYDRALDEDKNIEQAESVASSGADDIVKNIMPHVGELDRDNILCSVCGSEFHYSCLRSWCNGSHYNNCPYCRQTGVCKVFVDESARQEEIDDVNADGAILPVRQLHEIINRDPRIITALYVRAMSLLEVHLINGGFSIESIRGYLQILLNRFRAIIHVMPEEGNPDQILRYRNLVDALIRFNTSQILRNAIELQNLVIPGPFEERPEGAIEAYSDNESDDTRSTISSVNTTPNAPPPTPTSGSETSSPTRGGSKSYNKQEEAAYYERAGIPATTGEEVPGTNDRIKEIVRNEIVELKMESMKQDIEDRIKLENASKIPDLDPRQRDKEARKEEVKRWRGNDGPQIESVYKGPPPEGMGAEIIGDMPETNVDSGGIGQTAWLNEKWAKTKVIRPDQKNIVTAQSISGPGPYFKSQHIQWEKKGDVISNDENNKLEEKRDEPLSSSVTSGTLMSVFGGLLDKLNITRPTLEKEKRDEPSPSPVASRTRLARTDRIGDMLEEKKPEEPSPITEYSPSPVARRTRLAWIDKKRNMLEEKEQEEPSPAPIARRTRSRGKTGGAEDEGEGVEETKADDVEEFYEVDEVGDDSISVNGVHRGLQPESRNLDPRFDDIPRHQIESRFDGLSGPGLDREILRARRENLTSARRAYGVIPDSSQQQQNHPQLGHYRLRTLSDITRTFGQMGKISQYVQAQKNVEQAVNELDSMPRARKTDGDIIALHESMKSNTSDREYEETEAERLLAQKLYDKGKLHWEKVEKPAMELRHRLREEEEIKKLHDIHPGAPGAFGLTLDDLTLNDDLVHGSPAPVQEEQNSFTRDESYWEEDEN